jgi:hypothetical protein
MNNSDPLKNTFSAFNLYHQIAFLEICWQLEPARPTLEKQPSVKPSAGLILDETQPGQLHRNRQVLWVPIAWLFISSWA